MEIAMNKNTTRAAPHRIAHESMAVQPLTLERNKNRSSFYFARICYHFTKPIAFSIAQEPSPGRQQNFFTAPTHSLTVMPCRSDSTPPAQLLGHRSEFSLFPGSDSPRALYLRSRPNRPVEPLAMPSE